MKLLISLTMAGFLPFAAMAQAAEAGPQDLTPLQAIDVNLNDFLWKKRPVVVFADNENDPRYRDQVQFLQEQQQEMIKRDVVVVVDANPEDNSDLREKLRPRGFMMVLIDKDGGVVLRKPFPWNVRELSRAIDSLPLRQLEIRDRRALGN